MGSQAPSNGRARRSWEIWGAEKKKYDSNDATSSINELAEYRGEDAPPEEFRFGEKPRSGKTTAS